MFEIILLSMIAALFGACVFPPLASSMRCFFKLEPSAQASSVSVSSDVVLRTADERLSFLSYLQNEIEAELFPRPTCSVLQRHYDTLVAVELENRLAMMAE